MYQQSDDGGYLGKYVLVAAYHEMVRVGDGAPVPAALRAVLVLPAAQEVLLLLLVGQPIILAVRVLS